MRILDKFLIKNFLLPFLYCLCLFFFLYAIIDLFGHLDEILRENVKFVILLKYYSAIVPLIIVQTSPVASLISIMYVFASLNREGGVVAMSSAGINIWRILAPFILMGLLISVLIFLISEIFLPGQMNKIEDLKQGYIEKRRALEGTINNITLFGTKNRLFFIGAYELKNEILRDITILEHDSKQMVATKITARSAQWRNNAWMFKEVLIYNLDQKGEIKGEPLFFNERILDIDEKPKDLLLQNTKWEFTSSGNLYGLLKRFSKSSEKIAKSIQVELYHKISLPLNSLVLILIGAGFSLRPRKGGVLYGVGLALLIGFSYYVVDSVSIALGKAYILHPLIAAILANLLFGTFGIIVINKMSA